MGKVIKKWFPLFALPTFAAFTIAFLAPFFMGLYLSFCKYQSISNPTFVGIDNYLYIFGLGKYANIGDKTFLPALWFTVKFTIVSVITINVLAFFLASMLTKSLKGTNIFRTVFFMPNLIGGVVLGYIWQMIINGFLKATGMGVLQNNADYGFWGLVILMNWQMIGYMMIIYISGIQNISPDLLEAADIDGATKVQKLIHVTLPQIMPSITICLFLTLTNSFRLYDQNYSLTDGMPAGQTRMVALDIVKTYENGKSFYHGIGQAKAVIFSILVAAIALTQLYLTRSKEVES